MLALRIRENLYRELVESNGDNLEFCSAGEFRREVPGSFLIDS